MSQPSDERESNPAAPPPALFRHWVHSREEDFEDVEVFRPEAFAFPPSFGRDGFEMREDGEFVQDDIGPADGIVQVAGRWEMVGPQRVEVSFDSDTREGYSFDVVSVDETGLQITDPAPGGASVVSQSAGGRGVAGE